MSRSTFYRWVDRLKDGVPESMLAEKAARDRAESGEAAFVPISLKASPVEIELPNGGIVRLPLGVGQAAHGEVGAEELRRRIDEVELAHLEENHSASGGDSGLTDYEAPSILAACRRTVTWSPRSISVTA